MMNSTSMKAKAGLLSADGQAPSVSTKSALVHAVERQLTDSAHCFCTGGSPCLLDAP